MLSTPTPFPHVGSYALLIDQNLPLGQQRAELVRILRHGAGVTVAFPNRAGASGNRIVAESELVDGTPLTREEERELADAQGYLRDRCGTTPRQKLLAARADALRKRAIWSTILESELAVMRSREAGETRRGRGSIGRPLPRDAEEAA